MTPYVRMFEVEGKVRIIFLEGGKFEMPGSVMRKPYGIRTFHGVGCDDRCTGDSLSHLYTLGPRSNTNSRSRSKESTVKYK